jgi:alkaline phosphatase D
MTYWRRRDLLIRAGLGAMAFPFMPGCGGGDRLPHGDGESFRHGVASGDPLADRVILWTRVSGVDGGAVTVDWEVAEDAGFSRVLRSGRLSTGPERDYTVKVDADGLAPATHYYYRFHALGATSSVGRAKTLPAGPTARVRFAHCTCGDFSRGWFNTYRMLSEREDIDFWIHVGDVIYENGNTDRVEGRVHSGERKCVSLQDYRERHAQYKADPDLAALHQMHPLIWAWDDHEFANNCWVGDASNHNENDGDWFVRRDAAAQAAHEWMPIRTPNPQNLLAIQRRFRIGDLAELWMLETRVSGRDIILDNEGLMLPGLDIPLFSQTGPFADPSRSMLGSEQEAWFDSSFRASDARWRLVGNQTMFGQLRAVGLPNAIGGGLFVNPDQWDGYSANRARIFNTLREAYAIGNPHNTVFLSGDFHASFAMDLSPDPGLLGGSLSALAVEYVTPASANTAAPEAAAIADVLRVVNPHFKYVDVASAGYMIHDLTPERMSSEFWFVPRIDVPAFGEQMAASFEVEWGRSRVTRTDRFSLG